MGSGRRLKIMVTKQCEDHALWISGRFFKTAVVRDEPYQCLGDPVDYIAKLKTSGIKVDLLSFMQEICETKPKHPFHQGWESLAVVPVTTYEHWWKNQINDKARNMIRKGPKHGVEYRVTGLTDEFINGVVAIYNESATRQGQAFWHYGKGFEEIKEHLATFTDRCEFVGAYHQGELIGFIKFVQGKEAASLMQIISKFAHRDKAPTNGLVAKAVEMCEQKGLRALHYSVWGRRRGLADFKKQAGFMQHDVPRYFVPLTFKGRVMLKLNLHRKLIDVIPEKWVDRIIALRERWKAFKTSKRHLKGQ